MFDVHKVMQVMSEILSDRYDMKITMTAVPKGEGEQEDQPVTLKPAPPAA